MVDGAEGRGINGKILERGNSSKFIRTNGKVDVLLGQLYKRLSMLCEIFNENTHDSDGTQEASDIRDILRNGPIADLLKPVIVGFSTLVSAHMPNNGGAGNADTQLYTGEGTTKLLHPMCDPVHVRDVLKDEASDVRIIRESLVGTVG